MARARCRLPISRGKRKVYDKRCLALKSASGARRFAKPGRRFVKLKVIKPKANRATIRGSQNRVHERNQHCAGRRCRQQGPACQADPNTRLDTLTGRHVNKLDIPALLAEVDDGQPPGVVTEDADAECHTVVVFDHEYIAENGDYKTFRIEGPDVDGQEPGLAIEYYGSFDGFETVPLYVHAGGDGGPQSADAHGFVNIITDAMVPQVGQHVYGRWAIPTHGFAAGWYRGVVAVREQ